MRSKGCTKDSFDDFSFNTEENRLYFSKDSSFVSKQVDIEGATSRISVIKRGEIIPDLKANPVYYLLGESFGVSSKNKYSKHRA